MAIAVLLAVRVAVLCVLGDDDFQKEISPNSVIPTVSLLHASGIYCSSHWCCRCKSNLVFEVAVSLKSSGSICIIFVSQQVQSSVEDGKMIR